MPRTYLFVPPKEKAEVQALGASWDAATKRWYIDAAEPPARYSRWLPGTEPDEEFTITSSAAYVAATTTACRHCHAAIQVICIYCQSGTVHDEPLDRFTVSDIRAIDESLALKLRPWPHYRNVLAPGEQGDHFANHCPFCGAVQDDMYLHSEPDHPFFDIPSASPGSIELTPLKGSIRLSGDEHFSLD